MRGWLTRLRRQVVQGWSAMPGAEPDAPLLDSAVLRQIEHLTLSVRRSGTSGFVGDHASRRKAQSIEFADYRSYTPGDDFRLIDWNVYARLGELTLRLTEASEATTLHLLLDCSGSMAWGAPTKFRTMLRLAAALGCIALANYDGVRLGVLRGAAAQAFPRLRGRNEVGRFLGILEGLEPRGSLHLAAAVQSYGTGPRRGVGVLISDLLVPAGRPESTPAAIAALRQTGLEPTVIQVLAREESVPHLEGPFDLVDCETGAVLTTAIDGAALAAYARCFADWTGTLEETCRAQRTGFVRLYTDQPLPELLLGALRGQVLQ